MSTTIQQHQATATIPQSLTITLPKVFSRSAVITATNTETPIYTVKAHNLPRRLEIFTAQGTLLSAVKFHKLSKKVDVTLYDASTTLARSGMFSRSYSFPSFSGRGEWKWQRDGQMRTFDHVLVDERGVALAKMVEKSMSLRRMGIIEFGEGLSERGREEVVVTGVALAYELQHQSAAAGGAASVGASANSAAC